ncbi:MAG: hypothetical protein ACXABY_30215, partial [Candidatus Thorarchaeota archaeon]
FKDIQNLRPYDRGYRAVNGMSKINTTALATHLKARAGFHFSKQVPVAESHTLVQAWNTGETASKVWQNTTAIPSAGDFSGTALMDESAATVEKGRFSDAPGGQMAYCNGVDPPQIWAGDETNIAAFLTCSAAPANALTNPREFTREVNNDLTSADEVAVVGGGNDADTIVLLHGDGADAGTTITDDAAGGAHTWTVAGAAALDRDQKKFGTASMYFTGAAACQINCDADHADFQFNSGTGVFTIDFWLRFSSLPSDGTLVGIYEQYIDDDNCISVYVNNVTGTYTLYFLVRDTASSTVSASKEIVSCAVDTWYHCAVVRGYGGSANDLRVAVDGTFGATDDVTGVTLPDLAAAPRLGFVDWSSGGRLAGWVDEFRISKAARWTANFTPPNVPYFAASYAVVGTTRPADGIKFYIQTGGGNTTASPTLTAFYWNGSTWGNVKDTDNTSGLASTGTFTFTDNKSLSKPKYLNGQVLYWYYFYLDTGTASVYRVTADLPWQQIRNLYDGTLRKPLAFFHWDNSLNTYLDYTLDVNVDANYAYSAGPVAELTSLAANDDFILVGFGERMRGISFRMYKGKINKTASTDPTAYYWDGSAWAEVTSLNDETVENGVALAKSGVASWEPPQKSEEFMTEINGSPPLYFYKFAYDAILHADGVHVDRVFGIAEPEVVVPHKFSIMHRGRLFLGNEIDGEKNTMLPSVPYSPDAYNGPTGGAKLYFGDDREITGAASFYTRYGA